MKRYFSSVPFGSVPPAESSEAKKEIRAAVRVSSCEPDVLEILVENSALELVTLDRFLEPFVNEATPANRYKNSMRSEDPPSSPELHEHRLTAGLRGARCIAQIREGRFKSDEDFMNAYYGIARELQLTPAKRLQWPHQVHHLLPRCCGGSNEPSNLAPFEHLLVALHPARDPPEGEEYENT